MKRTFSTQAVAEATGPYSQAVTDGALVFTSVQIALTQEGELLGDEPIEVQTRQCLENVKNILDAEGLTLQAVLKVTVLLADINESEAMNRAYNEYFQDNPPARSTVEVANLPSGAAVGIEAVAGKR